MVKGGCAILDFDGTLFDSMFIWDQAGEWFLLGEGRCPLPSLREDLRRLSLYQSAQYLISHYDLPLTPELVMEKINRIIEHFYLQKVQPKRGAEAFLRRLRQEGVRVCIASASERYQIQAALERCHISCLVEQVFTCTEVGHGKEEPHIFRRAMQALGGEKGHTLVFEDALHAARCAKADGFRVVGVFDRSEPCQEELKRLSDCYLSDFDHTENFWRFFQKLC